MLYRLRQLHNQFSKFLSILCLSAPLREKNSPPTAEFRIT